VVQVSQFPNAFDERLSRYLPMDNSFTLPGELLASLQLAFHEKKVMALSGENGRGRTTIAAIYALHELRTGTLGNHPVLYFPFQPTCTLSDLLDSFGEVYEVPLLERKVDWCTLDNIQRLKLIQDVFRKVPLIWVWDYFENFEHKSDRFWPQEDRQALDGFLNAICEGTGRVMILCDQRLSKFLDDLPAWVHLPENIPNRLAEQVASLLPAAVSIKGKTPIKLPEALGLVFSSISEPESRLLPLLGLFYGIVDRETFSWLADEQNPWRVTVNLEGGICGLLERAAALKLVEPIAGSGYYLLDPAVSKWLAGRLGENHRRIAKRSFTQAMAAASRRLAARIEQGEKYLIDLLAVQEVNLRQALEYADRFRWRSIVLDLLKGLRPVFLKNRRFASWEHLLERYGRHFIHPQTHQPISRKDNLVKSYLALLVEACLKRDHLSQAANWQAIEVMWDRSYSSRGQERLLTGKSPSNWLDLVGSLARLAAIYRQMGSPKSIEVYSEVFQLARQAEDFRLAGETACLIAESYLVIPVAQNLNKAEEWLQAGLEQPDQDQLMHSHLASMRGKIAYEKFLKARKENQPIPEQVAHLNQALSSHFQALDLLPEGELKEQGGLYETIGLLYLQSEGMLETARDFYDQAIEANRQAGNSAGAARASYNLAVALFLLNDFERSRAYAETALQIYDSLAPDGVIEAHKVRGFLARFPAN
jgi:tetratricopeptide (TPR) repeat protein